MRRRGLTVVEVLVASAIVIVFLAVAYPAFRALTGRAHQSACAERLHTLGAALAMYAGDSDGALPPATTLEAAYRDLKEAPADEVAGSPAHLRELMKPYVPGEEAWFCPLDPHQGQGALWLGQRHRLTSFRYDPRPAGDDPPWPPKAQLGKEAGPLVSDAYGLDGGKPASNHADGMVNVVAQDLSLSRHRAKELVDAEPPAKRLP